MVESTAVSCIHPDKYNNSVDRIISKEEEREDPRRDSSIYLRVQNTVVFPHIIHSTRTTVFPHAIQWCFHIQQSLQSSRAILHTELILPQEILQLQGSSHAVQYKASSSDCSRVSKHSTWQNKTPSSLTSIPGPYSTSRLPVILPSRNSIPSGSQHPRKPYSSSRQNFTGIHLVLQNSTRRNRIHSKRVKYCMSLQY